MTVMVTAITSGIKISVETFFQPRQSDGEELIFTFVYRIHIQNNTDATVQLVRRYWHITDSDGKKSEVEGDGVVGEQPVLGAGQSYTYHSGCQLNSEIGRMKGTYLMQRLSDGKKFKVNIPEFFMIAPFKMN